MIIAISKNTSYKFDLSNLLTMISNSNMLSKLDYVVFTQALKINFENSRFVIAKKIFLRFIINNNNQL